MAATLSRTPVPALHPFTAAILAGTVPLFVGAFLADVAYSRSFEIQWTNFASWLLAGGLVFAAIALVLSSVAAFRRRGGWPLPAVLAVAWAIGFVDSLVHARDAWATMPAGLWLSAIVAVLAIVATCLGFAARRAGDVS